MKIASVLAIVFLLSTASQAQADTTGIEQYCHVVATPRLFSNKVTIDIDFGEKKKFLADNRLK